MLSIPTASALKVDQGDLKIDYKATEKDNISYRFTRAYQNNPVDELAGAVVQLPFNYANLQHGWRLDSNDQQ